MEGLLDVDVSRLTDEDLILIEQAIREGHRHIHHSVSERIEQLASSGTIVGTVKPFC